MDFLFPPQLRTAEGQLRRVGFELEFSGLDLEQTGILLQSLFGGRLEQEDRFFHRLTATPHGTFKVELDSFLLKNRAYEQYLAKLGLSLSGGNRLGQGLEEILGRLAANLVPLEIVTPPLPITKLHLVEELREALRRRKALGTKASFLYAFGLHINPEAASTEAPALLAILRSFFLLYEWIVHKSAIDLSRRIAPFITPFPEPYVRKVLEVQYEPDLQTLTDDFLQHNPTRNRPLDLLPLLAFLDERRVLSRAAEKHLIKPRPAFHYRLPNCLIDDPAWRIATEWNSWVAVEWLAADREKIAVLSRKYLKLSKAPFRFFQKSWAEMVESWLAPGSENP